MIVPMKHLSLVCLGTEQKATLEALRDLGVMHVQVSVTESEGIRAALTQIAAAERALRCLTAADKHLKPARVEMHTLTDNGNVDKLLEEKIPDPAQPCTVEALIVRINALALVYAELYTEIAYLQSEIARYLPFGNFSVEDIRRLQAKGLKVELFSGSEDLDAVPQGDLVQMLGQTVEGLPSGVVVNGELPKGCVAVPLPRHDLSWCRSRLMAVETKIAELARYFHAVEGRRGEVACRLEELQAVNEFARVDANTQQAAGGLCWLSGFVPADQEPMVRAAAAKQGWALLFRDPLPEEPVPTLLRPPKLFRPILALFKALDITPGYTESDVSVPFYIFFTIFFAMLVGDAGYGALILGATFFARWKFPKAPRAPFTLMTVFSVATIAWGMLTATYFGMAAEWLPAFLVHPWAKWLGDQNNIMQLCFTLGVAHLGLARLWNAIELAPDTRALAQIGWIGVLCAMYNIICGIVVQGYQVPKWNIYLLVGSVALVAIFMLKRNELKTRGIELGMLLLNVISSMGDIISYVRLFAVGMASVQVAQNFNQMAVDFDLPLWAKIPCMVVILLVGHGVNLAMGGLSILVHAVRLNTLEFSGAKGLSWAGFRYRPFAGAQTESQSISE